MRHQKMPDYRLKSLRVRCDRFRINRRHEYDGIGISSRVPSIATDDAGNPRTDASRVIDGLHDIRTYIPDSIATAN